ncbi:MAG TPA: guanylate kinase [Methylophilaceae bacterium]|nr:guanylate kinase [Methylophilaceae bacterium]
MTGNLFIITAPSGAGKTSLVRELLACDANVQKSVSYTTRQPRPGEVSGQDYHFVDESQFLHMLKEGAFLESAEVHGARYGTAQEQVEAVLDEDRDVVLEIDWQGAAQVRSLYPQAVSIFVLPPSLESLRQRLTNRGQDSDGVIARRWAAAREEMSHVGEFDYVTINDEFDVALKDICAIVRTQRLKRDKQLRRHELLLQELLTPSSP